MNQTKLYLKVIPIHTLEDIKLNENLLLES